jgi:hypothetical protein
MAMRYVLSSNEERFEADEFATREEAEGWLRDATKEQRAELDAQLRGVWLAWLERHGHMPTYFAVHEIEAHRTPAAPAAEMATCLCGSCRQRRERGE